jgi:hypothetical protein
MSSKEDKEFKINADFWFMSYFFCEFNFGTPPFLILRYKFH